MGVIASFILTTGIVLLVISIVIVIKKPFLALHRKILALIFIVLLCFVLYWYGEHNGIQWLINFGLPVTDSIGFLMGPLLLFYVYGIFDEKKLNRRTVFCHLTPAILYSGLISIPYLISNIKGYRIFSYLKFLDRNYYVFNIQSLYLLVYLLVVLFALRKYRDMVKNHYSNLEKNDLKWIKHLLYGLIVLLIFDLVYETFALNRIYVNQNYTAMGLVFLITYLFYFGTSQSQILLPSFALKDLNNVLPLGSKTVDHPLVGASEEEIGRLKSKLLEVMEDLKPYKNEELDLATLAELIPTSDRKLSALLNHSLKSTFYDFINSYRVKEVIHLLNQKENSKYTLLAIAHEAGFNSKSTFNRIFKKETGYTPSFYAKQFIK